MCAFFCDGKKRVKKSLILFIKNSYSSDAAFRTTAERVGVRTKHSCQHTHARARTHTTFPSLKFFFFFPPLHHLLSYPNIKRCAAEFYFKCYLHPRTCCCRLVPCHIPRLHMPVVYPPIRGNCRLPHQRFTLKSPERADGRWEDEKRFCDLTRPKTWQTLY